MSAEIFDRKEVFVGRDYGGIAYDITPELVAAYTAGTGDDNSWYRGESPVGGALAPALILHSAVYRNLDWYLPNIFGNLHTRQEWQLFAPANVGERLTTRAVIVDRYLKRDREYVVNEVIVSNAAGQIVSMSRTHQSFLLPEQTTQGFVVDRSREKDSKRSFKIGERGGQPIESPMRRITEAMCMAFSGPARNYHNDKQKAVELGFPEIVVQGMLSVCMVAEMMTQRFGLGFLYGGKMDLRLVNVVWGNDVTGPKGLIVETHPEGKRTRAEVEVWCDKSDGAKTIVGSASALAL
ncbi:MAG: MaoC family dehydratase [Candidatus Binatus sp.]|uniref:MaoC family dehydratase n=1 Tax=Candidatus Binatus sp. TaxID=2811406 RepID=UPI00271860C3|nr:MaoC family dehydratase [Candidatus Binatus sp.]MDO8434810.1 MaoC family dehydratase [Candidatus Binatus sp.]